MIYFRLFFTGSEPFFGLPTGLTFLILSGVSNGYIAYLATGLIPAIEIRFLALSYVIPSISAISIVVSPSILKIIGKNLKIVKNIHNTVKNTIYLYRMMKKSNDFSLFCEKYLILSQFCDIFISVRTMKPAADGS